MLHKCGCAFLDLCSRVPGILGMQECGNMGHEGSSGTHAHPWCCKEEDGGVEEEVMWGGG